MDMLYIYWIIKVSLYLVSGLIEDTQINNLFSGRNTKFPPPPVRPYSGSCFLDFFHPFFLYKYHIFIHHSSYLHSSWKLWNGLYLRKFRWKEIPEGSQIISWVSIFAIIYNLRDEPPPSSSILFPKFVFAILRHSTWKRMVCSFKWNIISLQCCL